MQGTNSLAIESHVLGEWLSHGKFECTPCHEMSYSPSVLIKISACETLTNNSWGSDIAGLGWTILTKQSQRMEIRPVSRKLPLSFSTAPSLDQSRSDYERKRAVRSHHQQQPQLRASWSFLRSPRLSFLDTNKDIASSSLPPNSKYSHDLPS